MWCGGSKAVNIYYAGASLHKVAFLHILFSPTLSNRSKRREPKQTNDYGIVENTTHDFFDGVLAPMTENIDNAIDYASEKTKGLQPDFANANAQTGADQIYIKLLLNKFQQLVVEQVLDYVIQTQT